VIERIELTDYQCHAKLDVRLDPGITTIVGDSDSGKSAIIRALQAVALNRLSGEGFVRRGQDGYRVRVRVDGVTVARERNGSSNAYRAGKKEFKSFGRDVPPDVSGLMRLSEDNFQGQHDPPFWFGLSAPELARKLNAVVDLELIDSVLSKLASKERSLRAEVVVVGDRLRKAKAEAASLSWVAVADADLGALEERKTKLDSLRTKRESLRILHAGAVEWKGRTDRAERLLGKFSGMVERIESLRRKLDDDRKVMEGLSRMVGLIADERKRIDRMNADLAGAEDRLRREAGDRCPVCGGKMK